MLFLAMGKGVVHEGFVCFSAVTVFDILQDCVIWKGLLYYFRLGLGHILLNKSSSVAEMATVWAQ